MSQLDYLYARFSKAAPKPASTALRYGMDVAGRRAKYADETAGIMHRAMGVARQGEPDYRHFNRHLVRANNEFFRQSGIKEKLAAAQRARVRGG